MVEEDDDGGEVEEVEEEDEAVVVVVEEGRVVEEDEEAIVCTFSCEINRPAQLFFSTLFLFSSTWMEGNTVHWTQWVPNKLLKNVQTLQKPSVRYGHATTSTGHQVVIHGGYNNKNQPTWMDDLWLFHRCSTSNEWEWTSVKGDGVQLIPEARYSHTLINLNAPKDMKSTTAAATTLYLFGGDDGGHRHAGELMTDSKSGYKWGQYFNDVWRVDIVVHGDHLFKAKWMKMKTRGCEARLQREQNLKGSYSFLPSFLFQ